MNVYLNYFERFFSISGKAFTSIKGLILMGVSTIIAMSGMQKALLALGVAFILDFITGCIASWIEHKKSGAKIQVYFFESSKMRLSVVKGVTYCLLIFFTWLFSVLFFDTTIRLAGSSKDFTVVEIIAGVCIGIEFWSNLENLKRAGFDLVGKVSDVAKQGWKLFNTVKTGKEEY